MTWDDKLFGRHLTTRRFGRELIWLAETDSTNRWLAENAARFTMSGGVVVAGHQTAGRGRHERAWIDVQDGSLLFSVLIRHRADDPHAGILTLIPAIALAEVLFARWGDQVHVSVKWPNDIQLDSRKVAGILGQTTVQDNRTVSVIGVGINLTLRAENLPADFRTVATSITAATGEVVPPEVILAEILGNWEFLFDNYLDGKCAGIRDRWERFGPVKEAMITRREGNEILIGHYLGLGEQGQLRLRDDSGNIHDLYTGDIEI
jgi:BirA family transcriptional regulator, biotin operon repressor / biotin---[acetyl-CoA-carboxylase] ligase